MKRLLLSLFLTGLPIIAQDVAVEGGFKITGMKCFSDKIINSVDVGKDGFKIEAGFRIGTPSGPGSELKDFTFPEDQLKQYFTFEFGKAAAGKLINVEVKAMKTTMGVNLDVVSVSGKTDDDGDLPAEWNLKTPWPVGLYKVFFTCEDKPVGTAGYIVKATKDRKTPIKAKGVTILSMRNDKPVEKTQLTPEDNNLIFKCATEGANTKGCTVSMFIGTINEKGEKERMPDTEVTVEDWPLENTELLYTLELPKRFPPGEYHMVFLINDELLTAHPFKVAE